MGMFTRRRRKSGNFAWTEISSPASTFGSPPNRTMKLTPEDKFQLDGNDIPEFDYSSYKDSNVIETDEEHIL